MKRTRRVIHHDFPDCSVPRSELRKIFSKLRERRIAARRTNGKPVNGATPGLHVLKGHEIAA
jgi:hypothetical protein